MSIYIFFGTNSSWNEGIDTCFNVECVLLGHNFAFLGGYCLLPSGYYSLLLVSTFSMSTQKWGTHCFPNVALDGREPKIS